MEEDKKEIKEEELKEVSGGCNFQSMSFCPHCKKHISMNDLVCPYCGQRIK